MFTKENTSFEPETSFESFYSLRLKECTRQIPVAELSIEWEKKILELIPISLKDRYPRCLENILIEIREIYKCEMEKCAIAFVVLATGSDDMEESNFSAANRYRRCNEHNRYDISQNRQILSNKYYLSHTIMRQIVEIASVKLSRVIIDLDRLVDDDADEKRDNEFFDLSELRDKFRSKINAAEVLIKKDYYEEIVKSIVATIVDNDRQSSTRIFVKEKIGKKKIVVRERNDDTLKLLRCATNLFSQQIVRIVIKTIDELIDKLSDYRRRCPRLNVRLVWNTNDDRLSIDPPLDEIYSTWHSLVQSIEKIANDLPIFEELCSYNDDYKSIGLINRENGDGELNACDARLRHQRMRISIPDSYAIDSHRKIDAILAKVLEPLEKHVTEISEEFEPVTRIDAMSETGKFRGRKCTELISIIKKSGGIARNMNAYCSIVETLKTQNERARDIADYLDYDVARLCQKEAKLRLVKDINDTRSTIVESLLYLHEEYNNEICRDFAELRDRLLDVPKQARELFKLAETVAYPSMRLLLDKFETRVTRSIDMLSSLLAVTSEMTDRHAAINGKTMNWLLVEIEPIFIKSNTLCEAMKSELEDELQRRIVLMNTEIEAVLPKFEILDQIDDPTRIDEYSDHVRSLVDCLDELDRQIEIINYEEGLFKFPETSFTSVEEIRDILVPVSSLISLTREWRRDKAVWLDGPFEYVDSVKVREKTILHYRPNFENLYATLRAKIKIDKQQTSTIGNAASGGSVIGGAKRLKLFSGLVDDPDPMQQPAPMTMCWLIIEEIKLFEKHLEVIECVCNPSLRDRHWLEISQIHERLMRSRMSTSKIDDDQDKSLDTFISPPDAGTTLRKLLRLDLAKDIEEYRVVSIGANKELAIANRLDEMKNTWDSVDFSIGQLTTRIEGKNDKSFIHLDEIYNLMDEHEVIVEEMRVSYFVKPIAEELAKFSHSLGNVRSMITAWLRVRNEWFDLEKVFQKDNENRDESLAIARQIFFSIRSDQIDKVERRIMDRPRFRDIARESKELLGFLANADENLEIVRSAVENYVDRARIVYPRFYFVADREVIDIIFETRYIARIKLLVRKCFNDIKSVRRRISDDFCSSMIDTCGDEIELVDYRSSGQEAPIDIDHSQIRDFFITEIAIATTIRQTIFLCSRQLQEERMKNSTWNNQDSRWNDHARAVAEILVNCEIGMAAICSWRLYWTNEIEKALSTPIKDRPRSGNSARISRDILASQEIEQSRIIETMMENIMGNEISRKDRGTLMHFIIEIGHQRDITKIVASKAMKHDAKSALRDFSWRGQVRHYIDDDNVIVAILDSECQYGYDYSGFWDKDPMIRTPLTDRCYRCLIEAKRNRYYGLVFGPGGNGKIHTIESLARTFGIFLKIYDCSYGHLGDYGCLRNIFSGLVSCGTSKVSTSGCWLVFKNLDHLEIQGLSFMAQQITTFASRHFDDYCNNGERRFGSFVTATITSTKNNDSTTYILPDTLKIAFRPIAFAFPDITRIVEVLLFANGFATASMLAEKMRLFDKYLCQGNTVHREEVLDSRDNGLRTIKYVVKIACALKIRYPNETEDALFLRSLVDVYLPGKMTIPSAMMDFQRTIHDLFPNAALPPPNYKNLLSVIRRVINADRKIVPTDNDRDSTSLLSLKIIQLYETLLVRHAVVVVGSSLAGKTTIIDGLHRSLSLLDLHRSEPEGNNKEINCDIPKVPKINTIRINHFSMSKEELFGKYDDECRGSGKLCWRDGMLTRALRSFEKPIEQNNCHRAWNWLILDGPLVESPIHRKPTTLLDYSSKKLYLQSGENISLSDRTSVIIETSSTTGATPGTISQWGMIYLEEEETISWRTRVSRWIIENQREDSKLIPSCLSSESTEKSLTESTIDYAGFLQSLLEWSLGSCLEFLQRETTVYLHPCGNSRNLNHCVVSVMRLLEIFLRVALVGDSDWEIIRERSIKSEQDRSKLYVGNFFAWSQAALLMSIVWGLGGCLSRDSRVALDEFCRKIWQVDNSSKQHERQGKNLRSSNDQLINIPTDGLIQNWIYVFSPTGGTSGSGGGGGWKHCSEILKRDYNNGSGMETIDCFTSLRACATSYVPTLESVIYVNLFKIHVKNRRPFIVIGETATGKTLYMRHLLKTKLSRSEYLTNFISFDCSLHDSSARHTQDIFLSRMSKLGKGVYGTSDKLERVSVNFIDDVRFTETPRNEGSMMLELIRQYYDNSHRCWYDVDNDNRIILNDVIFLAAMDSALPRRCQRDKKRRRHDRESSDEDDDSRNVTRDWHEMARFFGHFNLYSIERQSDESIFHINNSILLGNLRMNMFSADVVGSVTSMVNATYDVYSSIVAKLRPVPSKFQYRFTHRDLTRVINGCSLIHKDSAETKITLVRLWVHEIMRVFADRIVDNDDADWLFRKIRESATAYFKDSWDTTFDNLPKYDTHDQQQQLTRQSFRNLIFSDFMQTPTADNVVLEAEANRQNGTAAGDNPIKQQMRRYEEVSCSRETLRNRAISSIERYNSEIMNETRKLDVTITPEMLEHLMRICRILDMPGGSLMIVCFGPSSGRRSLTALATHIKSQRLEELSGNVIESIMTGESSIGAAWRQDFKRACTNCCCPIGTSVSRRSIGETNDCYRSVDTIEAKCTFFISDRDIIAKADGCFSILNDVCSIMKTGKTVPCLFTRDERDDIVERSRLLAQKGDRNREISSHDVIDYFYSKCQENLHFVLYFDSVEGIIGRLRGSRYSEDPAIVTKILDHCSIDCYECWPDEAFTEIGKKFMSDIDIEKKVKSEIIIASKYFYDSVVLERGSSSIVTKNPRDITNKENSKMPISSYIHMMKLYGISFRRRENETRETRKRYLSGLDKLKMADEQVREMRSVLTRLRPELELSAKETAETMLMIERENVGAAMATMQVKREEEVANRIAQVAGILKEECEADLAVAIPILEDAIAALNTLKPTDITLVKAMKNPPDTVKLVLAAVCVMLGVSPDRSVDPVTGKKSIDYWAPSKRILGDMNFLQNLKDYDKDNIPSSVMSVVTKTYINDESFMPHIVAKASSAAEGLCKWVRAMVSYDEVAKVVAPKKEKLAAAERECNASLDYLNEKRTRLAALNDKLAVLNDTLEATLAKKFHLEKQVASCTVKLKRAEALIASLEGEKARWLETADNLARTADNLAGDVLLSCGLVALLSSFDANHRSAHLTEWTNVLARLRIKNSGDSYDFVGSLIGEEQQVRAIVSESSMVKSRRYYDRLRLRISDDSPFNRVNTTIIAHSLLRPLIFDPQNLANVWIKRVEATNDLVTVKPTNPRWFDEIRACYDLNKPVLLENLDRHDYLERTPLILRYVGTEWWWWWSSSSSTGFRLYMTSRISFNEHSASIGRRDIATGRCVHPANVYKRFCIVNFTLANEALEDRLLEIIISRERPELRDNFDRLMITSAANRRLLEQEENKILEILSSSSSSNVDTSVNIIDDERAIEALDRSKLLSLEIIRREAESAITTKREMNELRDIYRPLTRYCAALYDTLNSLVYLNHMYRFSLDWFIRLYVRSIDTSMRSVVLVKRLRHLGASFTLNLETSVRNSLLDEHKLLYSFLLSLKILLDRGEIEEKELCQCLPLILVPIDTDRVNVDDDDISLSRTISLADELANALPDTFSTLSTSLREDYTSWKSFLIDKDDHPLPIPWNNVLTDFQRLILVNRLRTDKTLNEIVRLVDNTLGTRLNSMGTSFTSVPSANGDGISVLARSYDESSCVVPLIFVLPSYQEPHRVIENWGKKIGYSSEIFRFSMPPLLPVITSSTTSINDRTNALRDSSRIIENSITRARERGGWILLENCHLAGDQWLTRLEEICESLENRDDNDEQTCVQRSSSITTALTFRLWLTSYPSTRFPTSILHSGIKIHCERPSDRMRQNLLDSYATEPLNDPSFYSAKRQTGGGHYGRIFSKLIYSMCFFHAIVTGINRFYELAWNVPSYEFIHSDLKISMENLRCLFDRSIAEDANYEQTMRTNPATILDNLVYLVGQCHYGGKILDPIDRLRLHVILRDCCNDDIIRITTDTTYVMIDRAKNDYFPNELSVPNRSEYREFIRHIDTSIPIGESSPELFGLDENAGILRDQRNTDYFVRSFARLSASFLDDVGQTNECNYCSTSSDDATPLAPSVPQLRYHDTQCCLLLDIVRNIDDKLNLDNATCDTREISCFFNVTRVKEKYPILYEEPLNAVLIDEIKMYNESLRIICQSLVCLVETYDLKIDHGKWLRSSRFSVDIVKLARRLIENKIPREWLSIDQHCQTLSRFIDHLAKRRNFLNNWIEAGHCRGSIWLGGLFDCRKFLTFAQLSLARNRKIALYRLSMKYDVSRVSMTEPWLFVPSADDIVSGDIHIHGLYLSGAGWDIVNSSLVESSPKIHFKLMPMIRLRACNTDFIDTETKIRSNESQDIGSSLYYPCPLNSSSSTVKTRKFNFLGSLSNRYVTTVSLYSKDRHPRHWFKRRTLLYCNL